MTENVIDSAENFTLRNIKFYFYDEGIGVVDNQSRIDEARPIRFREHLVAGTYISIKEKPKRLPLKIVLATLIT
ncbi:hypothetical protein RCL_jg16326.t1 [Rhizophagus clarus]|uniref:Uncharacterized protein n=1 Tax=Rhizophagus clarus TaxID=94130 RepID=A0A8H3R0A7_9GLOM|nr:hypothetical protein RCL_jg16326.t1 [Rhizophagus clarus]